MPVGAHQAGRRISRHRRLADGEQVRAKPYFAEVHFDIIEDHTTRLLALKSGQIDESLRWQVAV